MAITYKQLQSVIAKRTGIDEETVAKRLKHIVADIRKAAASDEGCVLEGFGTFLMKDGELTFAPDEEFALEVNYKYAGMTPIQIMEGFDKKATKKDKKEEKTASDVAKKQSDEKTAQVSDSKPTETDSNDPLAKLRALAEAGKKTTSDKKEASGDQPATKKEAPEISEKKTVSAAPSIEKQEKPSVAENKASKVAASKPEVTAESQATPEKAKTRKMPELPSQRKKDDSKTLVLVAAMLALLLLGGLITWLVRSGASVEPPPAPNLIENGIAVPPGATRSAEGAVSTPEVPQTTHIPQYGLKGSYQAMDSYFTIVLYSLQNRERAEQEKNKFTTEGYRSALHEARTADGMVLFRVTVGQFSSVANAQASIPQLPQRYQDNNFITRIRS